MYVAMQNLPHDSSKLTNLPKSIVSDKMIDLYFRPITHEFVIRPEASWLSIMTPFRNFFEGWPKLRNGVHN